MKHLSKQHSGTIRVEPPEAPFTIQGLIDKNPDSSVVKLNYNQSIVLANSDGFSQIGLTDLWDDCPDFAAYMNYTGYKKHVFNSIVTDALLACDTKIAVYYRRNKTSYGGCNHLGYETVTKAISFLSESRYIIDFRAPATSHTKISSFFLPRQELCHGL